MSHQMLKLDLMDSGQRMLLWHHQQEESDTVVMDWECPAPTLGTPQSKMKRFKNFISKNSKTFVFDQQVHLLSRALAHKLHIYQSRYNKNPAQISNQLLKDIHSSSWTCLTIWLKLVNKTHHHRSTINNNSVSVNSPIRITLTCETTPSLLEYVGINRRNIGSIVSWRGVIFLKNRISNTIRRRSTVIIPFLNGKRYKNTWKKFSFPIKHLAD